LHLIWADVPRNLFEQEDFDVNKALDLFLRKSNSQRARLAQQNGLHPNDLSFQGLHDRMSAIQERLNKYYAFLANYYQYTPQELDKKDVFDGYAFKDNYGPDIAHLGYKFDHSVYLADARGNPVAAIDFQTLCHNSDKRRSDVPSVQTNFPVVPVPFANSELGRAMFDRLESERDQTALNYFSVMAPRALAEHRRFNLFVETDYQPTLTFQGYWANLIRLAGKPEFSLWDDRGYNRVELRHGWDMLDAPEDGGAAEAYNLHVAQRLLEGDPGAFRLGQIESKGTAIDPWEVRNHTTVSWLSTYEEGKGPVAQEETTRLDYMIRHKQMLKLVPAVEQAQYVDNWNNFFRAIETAHPHTQFEEDTVLGQLPEFNPTNRHRTARELVRDIWDEVKLFALGTGSVAERSVQPPLIYPGPGTPATSARVVPLRRPGS
jgi:hypothetical protein